MVKDCYGRMWPHNWAHYRKIWNLAPHEDIIGVVGESKNWEDLSPFEKRRWVSWIGNYSIVPSS